MNQELHSAVIEQLKASSIDAADFDQSNVDIYAVVCSLIDQPGQVRDYFQRQIDSLDFDAIETALRAQ